MTLTGSNTADRLATIVFVSVALGWTGPAMAANKARVELVPSVSAIAPGTPFDVALKFTVAEHWHLYWKNAGDAGLPPVAKWKLPAGFKAGKLRFPLPKRKTQSGIVTNLLEGQPVLLATITPPADIGSRGKVTIAADLKWLVCAEQCLNERQSVSLSLATVSDASAVKPAHEQVFTRARRRLPVSRGKAKYLTVTPSLSQGTLAPGATFQILIDVKIKPGFHIQSNKPLIAGLVATDVFMDPIEDVYFDPAVFPEPKVRMLPGVGKLSEFTGSIQVRIPAEADTELPGASRTIGGLLVYQACNEKGMCFSKEGVEWRLDIPIGQAALTAAGSPVRVAAGIDRQTNDDAGSTGAASHAVGSDTPDDAAAAVEPASSGSGGGDDAGWLERSLGHFGLAGLLLGCFLYGLFINATPCVLPLLSIKVLGFVQQAHESRRRTLLLGLSFGVGVILFFVLLGFLAASGKNILQFPVAVIALGTIVMALALSMLGVYTLQAPAAASRLEDRIQREGMLSSFGKGALAPVLGFACTGPLLASAFGWATTQPPHIAVLGFLTAGLGMASPYVLLGANPNWLSFVPKPGLWMITFERIMGFLLLAMVVNLLHPLVVQLGPEGLEWTLAFMIAVAMGCWVLGKVQITMPAALRWRYRAGAVAIMLVAGVTIYGWAFPIHEAVARQKHAMLADRRGGDDWTLEIPWHKWSPEAVRSAVIAGKTAFVDFTSASCTNCKLNKVRATNTSEVRAKMKAMGIIPFEADFTFGDPDIAAELQRHGQPGVPLNLIYPAGKPDQPIKCKTLFSKQYLLDKLDEAGPSSDVFASAPPHAP